MKKNKNRPGYKRTKAGWLPDDWFTSTPASFATICTGGRDTKDKVDDGEYPFFVRSQTPERIDTYSYDGIAVLTAGDGVGTGKVFHLIDGKFDYHQRVYKISDFDTSMFPRYFFECFRLNFIRQVRRYSAKGSVDSVRMEMIADMPIPLPSLPEQEAIAEVLECWDKAIRGYERKIEKKRNIKKGLMQRLLSGKQRLPGFDGERKEVRLGECGRFLKGKGISKDDVVQAGLPCIRYGQIYTTNDHITENLPSCINSDYARESIRIEYNDLLLAGSGETIDEIGKALAYMGTEEAYAGGDIVILRPNSASVRADYLAYYLNSEGRRAVRRLGQGQSVVHVYARDLMDVELPLPCEVEQQAVAAVFSSADTEISSLERKLAALREQKRFLLNNMVTGEIRLPQFVGSHAAGVTSGDTE